MGAKETGESINYQRLRLPRELAFKCWDEMQPRSAWETVEYEASSPSWQLSIETKLTISSPSQGRVATCKARLA